MLRSIERTKRNNNTVWQLNYQTEKKLEVIVFIIWIFLPFKTMHMMMTTIP